jgi:hypothetical protein
MATGGLFLAIVGALALSSTACRERVEPKPVPREKLPPRRVIDPPGTVRPLPPYAISNTAVGPYLLGAPLADVLYELPSGPRMALLDVPGLIKQNVIRAEDDGVLVSGAVLGIATVIAVVTKEVARTESGIAVGSSRAEVERSLGAAVHEPGAVRDPRLLVPLRMPSARLVLQGERVEAFLLRAGPPGGEPPRLAADAGPPSPAAAPPPPIKPEGRPKNGKDAPKQARDPKAAASVRCPPAKPVEAEPGPWAAACMSTAGEIIRVRGDEVSVRSGGDGKERVLAQLRPRGLLFAAPMRSGERPEDRDELVVVTRGVLPEERSWTVALYHLEAGRLVRVAEEVVYRLSAEGARWIGVSLDEVELFLELTSREDGVSVGGYLIAKDAGKIRDVVSLREADVSRRRGLVPGAEGVQVPPPAPPVDAGAGSGPVDGAEVDAAPPSPDAAP